jgi:hypothetical protein
MSHVAGSKLLWEANVMGKVREVALRALIGFEEDLMQSLIDGRADICVMYTPQSRPGLTIDFLLEEQLVMASTRADSSLDPGSDYIYVDWGAEFFAQHSLAFPNFLGAPLTVNIGWLGLQRLLAYGESGFWTALACAGHDPTGSRQRRRERTIRNGLSRRYVAFHGLKMPTMLMIASAMSNIRLF